MEQTSVFVQAGDPESARAEGAQLLGVQAEEVEVTAAEPGRYLVALRDVPGRFTIHLQADRTAAFLEILNLPRGNGEPLSLEKVLAALADQRITHGINQEKIKEILAITAETGATEKRFCIARGDEPQPGRKGRIDLRIGTGALNPEPEAANMVRHGQILAVRVAAEPGIAGLTIFGEEIAAPPVLDPPLAAGENVRLAKDGLSYVAEIYGKAVLTDSTLSVLNPVETAEDRMSAWIPVHQVLADNSRLELAGLTATLTSAGIVHGILEEEISAALAGEQPVSRLPAARGTPPQAGRDAEIQFHFRINGMDPLSAAEGGHLTGLDPKSITKELVAAGDLLAVKTPALPGKDGCTVTGEIIPAPQPRDIAIAAGENVSDDDCLTFRMADTIAAGYAEYGGGVLKVTDPMRFSEDSMQVLMEIHPPAESGRGLTAELLIRMLKQHRINHGIRRETIRQAVALVSEKCRPLHDVVIARGTPAVPGRDGRIELQVAVEKIAGRISEQTDIIDFRERNAISSVREGEVLARRIPAEPGEDGHDVLGRQLKAKPGADIQFAPQPNVLISEDGLTLTAGMDGMICVLDGNKIAVFQVFEVKSDVDYATGNLEMSGNLHISGWVRSGFTARASGDIQIGGGVEDAVVTAAANVLVNGGVIRREHGMIKAGGDVNVRFLEGARVHAGGNVYVRDQLMRSKVFAKGILSAIAGRGRIRGGMVSASQGIEANEFGSAAGVKTVLMAGTNPALKRRLLKINRQMVEYRRQRAKMDMVLGRFLAKGRGSAIPREVAVKLSLLGKMRRDIVQAETRMARYRDEAARELAAIDLKRIRIIARKMVYAGTIVVLGGIVHRVSEDIARPVSFYLDEENRQVAIS